MRKQQLIIVTWVCFILLTGCSNDPNEKANELYVGAIQYAQSMRAERESYSKTYASYKSAREDIETILSKYPSSNLAVSLVSGETRISDFTLTEFRKLGDSLEQFAEAEQDVVLSIALIAKKIKDKDSKANALGHFAGKAANAGHFTLAIEIANTIGKEAYKGYVLAYIASKAAEAGQQEKATQLLSQAIKIANTIRDGGHRASALAYIESIESKADAGKAAEAGNFTQAIEIANKIKDKDSKASALATIAGKAAEAGRFTQAIEIANTIRDGGDRASALADIASKTAEAGQQEKATQLLSQAIKIANTIEDGDQKSSALIDVMGNFVVAGHKPSQKDIAHFKDIFQTIYPISGFWEFRAR